MIQKSKGFKVSAVTNALSAPASRVAGRPCPPLDHARSATLSNRARHERHSLRFTAAAAGFRLRLCGGRCAQAAIRYARLSASAPLFPLADQQTEASMFNGNCRPLQPLTLRHVSGIRASLWEDSEFRLR